VAAPKGSSTRTEIKPGMTIAEVRRAFGAPDAEVVFGGKTKWQYKGMAVVFVDGKVTDVQF
jgi:hypothetical protein